MIGWQYIDHLEIYKSMKRFVLQILKVNIASCSKKTHVLVMGVPSIRSRKAVAGGYWFCLNMGKWLKGLYYSMSIGSLGYWMRGNLIPSISTYSEWLGQKSTVFIASNWPASLPVNLQSFWEKCWVENNG